MGAANCCKKPEQIVCEEIKENGEGDKMNALDQDSYPQDTEYVFNGNAYPQDDKAQQEVSNQMLYEQEGSPKIGGAYEVAINSSSPIQYDQVEVQTPEKINQEVLVQNEMNNNQYSPEELAMYQNQININAKPDSYKEEIQELNQNEKPENLENLNQNQDQEEIPIKESNGPKQIEIKQSDISNLGAVKFSSLISQRSAAPVNTISQVVQSQQVIQTPETNSKALKIQQVPQTTSQIQVKEVEEGEDLNKYFQIPTNLAKAKTTIPSNIQINDMQKFIQQNQSQKGDGNVASVTPIAENDDINNVNNYFNQLSSVPQTQTDNMTDEEILNKYFSKTTSQEVKPEEIIHNNLNVQNIINMKDLPPTFGSHDINNFKQTTTTTTTKTTGNIPAALTSSEIKKIIDMKDLPETLGSNDINNFKQTTTTTTTKTTGNIDLKNIPGALTSSEIKKIIDMKDLPTTFGSNDIKNFKQTTTTTTTKTTGNIPGALTASQIKNIIDMKDLPETFGSSNISKVNKTTVTSTTTTTPANIDLKQFGLEQNPSMGQFNSHHIDLKQFGLEPMRSQTSTAGKNKQVTTVTKSVQKNVSNPTDDYSKYFQNIQTSSNNPIDLQQFGLEKNASNISNILQGSNIAFKQQGQTSVSSANYGTNNDLGITSASTPIITNDNYGKYFKTTKTTTTSLNQTGIPYSTNVNLNNYGINIPQGKTTTATTTTKTSGIPISSSSVTQNYTLPANYAANKVTSSKVTKTYVGPTQTSSYNYSYNIPTITPTTTTVKK